YRQALPYETAAQEIVQHAGEQHCATVVAVFDRLFASGRFRVEAGEVLARSLSEKIEQEYNDW
ncbi:MAG: hypothetical protein ABIV06_02700, partial [Thermoanaerobaculia bacterium]